MRLTTLFLAAALCWSQLFVPVHAQDDIAMTAKSRSGVSLDEDFDVAMCSPDGLGVGGYDLVSYRQAGGPREGKAEFSVELDGKSYRFADRQNLERFNADPGRYLPAYAGFCAITLALGRVTCPDYRNFKIEDDRLLLFEVTGFTNGRTLWNSDPIGYRQRADRNYGRLVEQP